MRGFNIWQLCQGEGSLRIRQGRIRCHLPIFLPNLQRMHILYLESRTQLLRAIWFRHWKVQEFLSHFEFDTRCWNQQVLRFNWLSWSLLCKFFFVNSLVTQPMMQPNQTELRSMDSYIQILCRFQKCKGKVPPPLLLSNEK